MPDTTFTDYRFAPSFDDFGTVRIPRDKETAYRNLYRAFGWNVEYAQRGTISKHAVALQLQRERYAALHAQALNALQGTGEEALRSIAERERTSARTSAAIAAGIALPGFLASALICFFTMGGFALTPVFLTVLALPWSGAGYLSYRLISSAARARHAGEIDENYDVVEQVSVRARRLLRTDGTWSHR